MSGVKIIGLDKLEVALKKNTDLDAVRQVVKENGNELTRRMTEHAEFAKGYQTGTTKRSIAAVSPEISDGGLTVTVRPDTEYAAYLEYGTRNMEAQPFVGPAFREQEPIFINDLKKLTK